MTSDRFLYIPVETKAREFLGKTFLAARAAERGWIAVIGEGNELREFMRDQPRGAYIEIGIPEKKANCPAGTLQRGTPHREYVRGGSRLR